MTEESEALEVEVKSAKNLFKVVVQLHVKVVLKERNIKILISFPTFLRCTAFSYLEGDPELAYFAIYDGHGGTGVANYLKDHLHEFILDQPEYTDGNIQDAVVNAFLKVSQKKNYIFFGLFIW